MEKIRPYIENMPNWASGEDLGVFKQRLLECQTEKEALNYLYACLERLGHYFPRKEALEACIQDLIIKLLEGE
jgi:hypothetical protein